LSSSGTEAHAKDSGQVPAEEWALAEGMSWADQSWP
jgi:hypothetical protein